MPFFQFSRKNFKLAFAAIAIGRSVNAGGRGGLWAVHVYHLGPLLKCGRRRRGRHRANADGADHNQPANLKVDRSQSRLESGFERQYASAFSILTEHRILSTECAANRISEKVNRSERTQQAAENTSPPLRTTRQTCASRGEPRLTLKRTR